MGITTNILPDREPFVGRVRECARLKEALLANERLIVIIGPCGMGKTRLARQVAIRLAPELLPTGGVWFCDLTNARTKADLVEVVSRVLQLPAEEGAEGRIGQALAARGLLLLLLDNCELLDREAFELAQSWLDHAPELRLLATSLLHLDLEGEYLFELGPLESAEAVALYEDRARRAWADRAFFSGEERAIAELVERLDRFPLAIELAAARVRVLPPRAMLSRIEDRFELLQSRRSGNHSSLEWAIGCSWELLDPQERSALAQASIFSGGCTLEAAEGVLVVEGPRTVVEILEGLRKKALLQLDSSASPRFSLYESVRAYAARELSRGGGQEAAAARHRAFFLRYGATWAQGLAGPEAAEAIDRLAADRQNLLELQRRQPEGANGPDGAEPTPLAVRIAAALAGKPFSERMLVDETVAAARQGKEPRLLVHALRCRAAALLRHGLLEEAGAELDEGLGLAVSLKDRRLEALLRGELGRLRLQRGELDEAQAELERALECGAKAKDPYAEGSVRMALGALAEARGALEESRRHFDQGAERFRRCGDLRSQGFALVRRSGICLGEGDLAGVRAGLDEARELLRLAGEAGADDVARAALDVERVTGKRREVALRLLASVAVERRLDSHRHGGYACWIEGLSALERGDLPLAARHLGEAAALLRESGDSLLVGQLLPFQAATKALLGQLAEAGVDLADARSQFEALRDPLHLAIASVLEGFLDLTNARLAHGERRLDDAVKHRDRALARLSSSQHEQLARQGAQLLVARRLLGKALTEISDQIDEEKRDTQGAAKTSRAGSRKKGAISAEGGGAPSGGKEGAAEGLLVGPDAVWFEYAGKPRAQLGRRGAQRRLLQALVEHRLLAPGVGLSLEQMSKVGWPGETVHPAAAANRVYNSVNGLRKAGLEDVLMRHADGYFLSPDVQVVRARD